MWVLVRAMPTFIRGGGNLQVGILLETLDISKFEVRFDTLNLPANFTAALDYAGTYNAVTPYVSYKKKPDTLFDGWFGKLKLTLKKAWMPTAPLGRLRNFV